MCNKEKQIMNKPIILSLFFMMSLFFSAIPVHAASKKMNVISKITYDDGSYDKYSYNKNGLIDKIKQYDSSGELSRQTSYHYNDKGLLSFYNDEPMNGIGHAVGYNLEYDEKGRLIQFDEGPFNRGGLTKYIYNNSKVVKIEEYSGMGTTYEGAYKVSYKKSRISKIGKTKYKYDKKGNLRKISGKDYTETYENTYKGSKLVKKYRKYSSSYGVETSSRKYSYKKIAVSKSYRKRIKKQQWVEKNEWWGPGELLIFN